ncbi:MAG: ribosome biogenesis GTPase Der [bacterium]
MDIVVSIVGRPNVGKSSLFNLLIDKGIAVVSEYAGTTRDLIVKKNNKYGMVFIDTGGVSNSNSVIDSQVLSRVEQVINQSDVILFVVDNQEGLAYYDQEIADIIRKSGLKSRTILVLNKSESSKTKEEEFEILGFRDAIQISCKTGMNIKELIYMIKDVVNREGYVESEYRFYSEEGKKIGFVGRPNVGKSSLINVLLNTERLIVSEIAGTTRDSIDIPFEYEGKKFVLIDTPGVRRKSNVSSKLEVYSITRALGTIKYADIVCLVVDISEGITRQDKRLVYQIYKHNKPCLIVANKFDILMNEYRKSLSDRVSNNFWENLKYELSEEIKNQLYLIPYAPVVFVSAKERYQIDSILYTISSISDQLSSDFSTLNLKEIVQNVMLSFPFVQIDGKKVKLKIRDVKFYKEEVPTFKIYSNVSQLPENLKSYLRNTLGRVLNIPNVPVKILITDR